MKAPDPLLGTVLDNRYVITARIARGGMATVYRATDQRLQRDVALKIIHPHLAEQPDFVRRFISEARAAASLSSPNIVAVYDQGIEQTPTGDRPYLVMELMGGADLRSELNTYGSFPLGVSLELIRQVLTGLAGAHHAGIIHRDIKPENVLLTAPLEPTALEPKFQAKLTDFGLARAASNATSTQTNTMLGTVGYIAPEFVSDGITGKTGDIYSVGIMLYELLAGQLPFQGESAMNVAFKHVNETMARLTDQVDWMPPAVDSLIGLFTAKSPAKRPQNAEAALDALTDIIESIPEETLIRRIPVFPLTPNTLEQTTVADDSPSMLPGSTSVFPPLPQTLNVSDHQAVDVMQATRYNTDVAPPKKKRRRWPLVLLLLVLLGSGGYGTWWYFTEGPGLRVTIPNVLGLTQTEAETTLRELGLTVSAGDEFSDDVDTGLVMRSDPVGGSSVHPSQTVEIIVSAGIEYLEVPSAVHETQDDATTLLVNARFTPEITEAYSETIPTGTVISQSPEAGESVAHDSVVTLTVSLGPEPISVPDLTEGTIDDALARLADEGLDVNTEEIFSDTIPAGQVISQQPEAGQTRYRGDTVELVVSKGPELVEVPDVFGVNEDKATQILEDAGFVVSYDRFLGGYFGTVRQQSPAAGEMRTPGTVVTITVV